MPLPGAGLEVPGAGCGTVAVTGAREAGAPDGLRAVLGRGLGDDEGVRPTAAMGADSSSRKTFDDCGLAVHCHTPCGQ